MNTSITKPNPAEDANLDARPVKDIIEPAKTVLGKVSVQAALDEMQAREIDSAVVTNQRGELLGTVSSNEMNRKVGGLGHDPKTEPIEAQVEKNNVYCFEDQTVAEAEQIMCDAKVAEVPVVTHEKLLVGTTSLEAIAQDKRWILSNMKAMRTERNSLGLVEASSDKLLGDANSPGHL